jgi:hypothetical protein
MAVNPTVGTRTSVTVTGLSTLASANYVTGTAVTHNTNKPVDNVYEVDLATTNTVAGNKQCKIFLQVSMDGTNYTSGPTSGATTTDEPDLYLLGTVPMNTSTTTHSQVFSIGKTIGFIPYSSKIIIFNDVGVALTSGSVFYSEISIP